MAGLVVPASHEQKVLPQQPQTTAERSLQININSADDAKAVIQHLGKIKQVWELTGCQSVEFVIAANVEKKTTPFLTGAINWCRTYVKRIEPFEGNVPFELPHYVPVTIVPPVPKAPQPETLVLEPEKPLGKSRRPVPASTEAG